MTEGFDRWQVIRRNRVVCWACRKSAMCEPVDGDGGEAWLCDRCRKRRAEAGPTLF